MDKLTLDMLDEMVEGEIKSAGPGAGTRPLALEKLMEQAQLKRAQATETIETE